MGVLVLTIALIAGIQVNAQAATNWDKVQKHYEVKVYMDSLDNELEFKGGLGKPFIAVNRTFVPYRVLGEALGADVSWNNAERKVTAVGNDNTVQMFIGNTKFKVNNVTKTMDVEPFILTAEGRTYIPARYITEGLNYYIDFTQANGKMCIVVFTLGQTESERKVIIEDIANGVSSGKATPVTPAKPEFNTGKKTPLADPSTYKVEGNHYIIYGDFIGKMQTEKYTIYKRQSSIGSGADVVTIYPRANDFSKIAVTCTSHPELNTLNYYGSINDMTRPNMQYQLNGQGYAIPIVKGMTIELKEAGGDTFTITI